jgi:hypothetical protein
MLGPLFQCMGIMTADIGKWAVLTLWPLLAFSSCFTVLFREPCLRALAPTRDDRPSVLMFCERAPLWTDGTNADMAGCKDSDFDVDLETWPDTARFLLEVVLTGDVDLGCARTSSMTDMAWILMMAYLLINVIMLVNLLIACVPWLQLCTA